MYAERCAELQQQADALRQDLEAAHVNNAHLLRVRSILELSEKRLAEAVAQVIEKKVRLCIEGFNIWNRTTRFRGAMTHWQRQRESWTAGDG